MARKSQVTVNSPWADYLRSKRLSTKGIQGKYRPKETPMSQADFVEFINKHIKGKKIGRGTYVTWEYGSGTTEATEKRVRKILDDIL